MSEEFNRLMARRKELEAQLLGIASHNEYSRSVIKAQYLKILEDMRKFLREHPEF